MHLHEIMGWSGPLTHRQFLLWRAWLDEQWNRPSRSDHYLMGVGCEVRRANARNPAAVQLSHLKITFERVESARPMSDQQIAASKARWMRGARLPVRRVTIPRAPAEE